MVTAGRFCREPAHAPRVWGELNNVPGIVPEMYYHTLLAQLGSAIVRYREYVTFHSEYTYPEYLIAYQRNVSGRLVRT